ncbi:hypothetical protein D6R50_13115 [Aeromonas veronii]|nr:hypothetical protein [Aeromonas veronii]RKJ87219.1 hypothetical protein D6R50_13115 [Aeromonas veronii]
MGFYTAGKEPEWLPYRAEIEYTYEIVRKPIALAIKPALLDCGTIAATTTRTCGAGFKVHQQDGAALPRGALAFRVPADAMTGDRTVAKMGGAGTMQVMANGVPVPLDGTTWTGDVTSNVSFVPRITGTGAEMGEKTLNVTATFTAD